MRIDKNKGTVKAGAFLISNFGSIPLWVIFHSKFSNWNY